LIADAIEDACKTYPLDWIQEAINIAVKANKRNWKYVEGILKNCKAKDIHPSLNIKERNNDSYDNSTGNRQRAKQSRQEETKPTNYSEGDLRAAERVRQRRAKVPAV
jgi:DNA replication protein DnaD